VPDAVDLENLAEKVTRGRLSVRQTEALVRRLKQKAKGPAPSGSPSGKSPSVRDLEVRLSRKLGTKCEVKDKNGKGQLLVSYSSWDELDRLLEILL
jgi:ParB family chromosome partitioning protein